MAAVGAASKDQKVSLPSLTAMVMALLVGGGSIPSPTCAATI